jgi:hypothetical protein
MKRTSISDCSGFILVSVILFLGLFLAMFAAYYATTNLETATTRHSLDSATGFYAAEAGLNVRAEEIRQIFVGFNRPTGTSPTASDACSSTNHGTGDYACREMSLNSRTITSYLEEDAGNPLLITIPPGERYQNLSAQEYRYTAHSSTENVKDEVSAELQLQFKSRLVPLFQFAAFYSKDLEILPGPVMTLAGPVHTNGDLYLYSNSATLTINGQVTAAGKIWRGRKDGSVSPSCNNNAVKIPDPGALRNLVTNCPSRHQVTAAEAQPFNGMVQYNVQAVTIPGPEVFDPDSGKVYWDHADLRLVLKMTAADNPNGIEVRNANDTNNSAATLALSACTGTVSGKATGTTSIFNYRENKTIQLLDVDLIALFNCLYNSNWFTTGKRLDESSDGGIVFHFTVKGPNSLAVNKYGVRLKNAARLGSNVSGAPAIRGLTIVSDQALYVQGNYNSTTKKPAALMADSVNILSTNWSDANSNRAIANRIGADTTINTAFLSGTDTTGNHEGTSGQGGAYNGGLENYPRFHEDWSGKTLAYRGSFVSLGNCRRVSGTWATQSYSPPNRDWNYDTSFNNAANLPPITPRFVYLRQELFVRDFEHD